MSRLERWGLNGEKVLERVIDPVAETVTTTVTGETPVVEPIDPDVLASIRADEREERQLGRVDTALTDLKAQTRLTVSDYRFDTTTVTDVDVRELARRINALERLNKDLIRLVRGLAAEDEA